MAKKLFVTDRPIREAFTTTISKELLDEVRQTARECNPKVFLCDIVEQGMRLWLEEQRKK